MCGIAGVYPLNRYTRRMLPYLAWDMEERGDDSWGISNGTAIYKAIGPVTGGYRIPHNFQEGDAVVLHTRAASVGSVSVENSHPFRVTGTKKSIIGVHNGGVGNHKTLAEEANKQLAESNFPKFEYSVDSNALYMYMACGGDTSRVYGTGALVWWDWITKLDKRLNFLRFNTEALHIVKLEDESIAWCSTKDTLVKAARMAGLKILFHYDIKGDTHYQLQPELMLLETYKPSDGYPIVNMGKMTFGTSVSRNTSYQGYCSSRNAEDDEIAEHYRNYHTPTRYSGAPWTTIHTGSITKIIYPNAAIIHDTGDDKDIEEAHNKVIYGNGWQRQGMGDICSLCKEAYKRDNNPGFVLRTKSNYICGTCINDVWLELIDGLTTEKLPLILGVTASSTPETTDTLEKDTPNDTQTTPTGPNPGPSDSSGEKGTEKNITTIPTRDTREGDARSGSAFEEDPADCYAEFGAFGC